ncbi:MAG: 1-acyl-sn-glycerol-3-phosphate acyltransferase [Clostridia bacterium]|nr:1-acyl-sn-glycerol-3-phosphate acyltransferase [Clostridia bacterium]
MSVKKKIADVLLKTIHYHVRFAVFLTRRQKLRVEGKVPKGKCIFVANHFCYDDLPTAISALERHFYVLASDVDRHTLSGVLMRFNGLVWVDRTDREDRRRAAEEMKEHIRLGHRVLLYPEGLWNVTPHLPMLPMFNGAVRFSQETGVPIVPAYSLFRDGECRVRIGEAFRPGENAADATLELRDRMATLYYDLLEQFPAERRADIPEGYWRENVLERCRVYALAKKDPAAYLADEARIMFRPKDVVSPEEAFAHLRTLRPNPNNAFLLNPRLSYDGSVGTTGAAVLKY